MTMYVVIEIGGKVGGQITGHAVEILQRFEQRRRLLVHRLNAHDGAGCPLHILGQPDYSFFDDRRNAHAQTMTPTALHRKRLPITICAGVSSVKTQWRSVRTCSGTIAGPWTWN
jgi:hypothetical protein